MTRSWRCEQNIATHQDPMVANTGFPRDSILVCRPCAIERFQVGQRYATLGRNIPVVEIPGDVVTR